MGEEGDVVVQAKHIQQEVEAPLYPAQVQVTEDDCVITAVNPLKAVRVFGDKNLEGLCLGRGTCNIQHTVFLVLLHLSA